MSNEKKNAHHEDNFEQIEEALTRTEQFIEKYQKQLTTIVLVVVAIIAGVLGYNKFYKAPIEKEAIQQTAGAQLYFSRDSFNLALKGDGNALGFVDIINDYSSTTIGNTAKAYAGICCLKLGKFDEAIEYLEGFSSDDFLVSQLVVCNLGDAYMEKGNYKKAADYYEEAASNKTNDFTTPIYLMKAGNAHEMNKDFDKAITAYERIEKEFARSFEARDIEKYITRAKLQMK